MQEVSVIDSDFYNSDYYERGLETGKSSYQNYRWMPECTIPLAMTIIDHLCIQRGETVLDFGCAKGYLVKALRLLHRDAWGVDISEYAINNVDTDTVDYCFLKQGNLLVGKTVYNFPQKFKFCIAKDVFEHIVGSELERVLHWIPSEFLFVVVPLGNGKKFISPVNELDSSHCNCWKFDVWKDVIEQQGWECIDHHLRVDGIKDSYYGTYPDAHGFFLFRKLCGAL